jgi:hypothetical protein
MYLYTLRARRLDRGVIVIAVTWLLILISSARGMAQADAKGAANPFANRSGADRAKAVDEYGGTKESEEAVERGLKWLARQQLPDGRWMVGNPGLPASDRGRSPSVAGGTALGLLPYLGAGKTHKPAKDNPYAKNVDKGLKALIRLQAKNTGYFGDMYAQGLGTMALCEAYGMTKDPALRASAQAAVDLIVKSQHDEAGGWRYTSTKTDKGDLSVTGFQAMALKAAKAAGLKVPDATLARILVFLNSCASPDEGYTYLPTGPSSTPTMTAVGLLLRQHLENWDIKNPRLEKAVSNIIKPYSPKRANAYFNYYASQVMFQCGGKDWQLWNSTLRDYLLEKQDKNAKNASFGSWSPQGDPNGMEGGRLMVTSFHLLALEVYYRYTPLPQGPPDEGANHGASSSWEMTLTRCWSDMPAAWPRPDQRAL